MYLFLTYKNVFNLKFKSRDSRYVTWRRCFKDLKEKYAQLVLCLIKHTQCQNRYHRTLNLPGINII